MVYKKKLLPKPVALDRMAPQSFSKQDFSEYTCVCPTISRLWTSKEELKKTVGSLTSGSERTHVSAQVHVGDKPRILWGGAVFFFLLYMPFHFGSVCTLVP